ncbi:hypothetical protein EDB85DRAFT_1895058 [Lactarius pseudohatsudake]|nr:hypothetical protein EDB85DRAFT_1895058 [Lactarius pseudohatsudake]
MALGQERAPKTPKTRIRGSSHRIREDAGVHPYSARTSLGDLYLRFARATGLLPPTEWFTRATTEDAALDSFQNVLFSVVRFRELTGAYSPRITVVGHDFKRRRFGRLYQRTALAQAPHVGIPLGTEADERQAVSGEVDLYDCHAPTQTPTGTTSVRQKCASCWSGVRGMARGSFLAPFLQNGTLRTHTSFESVLSQAGYK